MTPSWTVEGALQELVDAIQEGSPLKVEPPTQYGYKERYRQDFEDQYRRGIDWNQERDHILNLAREVGLLASTLTLAKAMGQGNPIPFSVDEESAYLAGFVVAQTKQCPPIELLGHWCSSYPIPDQKVRSRKGDEIVASLRKSLLFLEDFGA